MAGVGDVITVGTLATTDGRTIRMLVQPEAEHPFRLAISGKGDRETVTLPLTAIELEQLLTLMEQAAQWP